MWQRIQTVFLGIVVVSLVLSIFTPIWIFQDEAGKIYKLYSLHYTIYENGQATPNYIPYAITAMLAVAAATVAVIQIRKFKDRFTQIKLGALNSLLIAATIGSAVVFTTGLHKTFPAGRYSYSVFVLYAVAVLCNWLAMRFIRKDEKLVRDSDRLR